MATTPATTTIERQWAVVSKTSGQVCSHSPLSLAVFFSKEHTEKFRDELIKADVPCKVKRCDVTVTF